MTRQPPCGRLPPPPKGEETNRAPGESQLSATVHLRGGKESRAAASVAAQRDRSPERGAESGGNGFAFGEASTLLAEDLVDDPEPVANLRLLSGIGRVIQRQIEPIG